MTEEKLKVFLMNVLGSEYAGLPKQMMYWERQEDCHNLAISAMMTKTEFPECKQYLHLAHITLLLVQVNLRKCDRYLKL